MAMKRRATIVLVFFIVLALAGRWWSLIDGGFWSGLLYHCAVAATIGGLADWFAVTALFHRPLGIGWRTDILRRNRPRLMGALVEFFSDELLGAEHIRRSLAKVNIAELLADYLTRRGGRQYLTAAVTAAVRETLLRLDCEKIAAQLAPAFSRLVKGMPLEKLVPVAVAELRQGGSMTALVAYLARNCEVIVQSAAVQTRLTAEVTALLDDYAGNSMGRRAALNLAGLNAEKITSLIGDALISRLRDIGDTASETHAAAVRKVTDYLLSSVNEIVWQEQAKAMRERLATAVPERIAPIIAGIISGAVSDESLWYPRLEQLIAAKINALATDAEQKKIWDDKIKNWLLKIIDDNHSFITAMVEDRLNDLSDDELVKLAEDHVADDLQSIRINGSVTGGLVGALLYIITRLAEGVWPV